MINRRSLLLGAAAWVASSLLPDDATAFQVPRDAFWLHLSNLDHGANPKLERARKNGTRVADVSEWRVKNNSAYPLHPGLITSAVHAYNLARVPSALKGWHQPGGAELNEYRITTQDPGSLRGYGRPPRLAGQKAQATWVLQTAGDVATLEFPTDMLIRDTDVQVGTYFVVCHTAGQSLMIPGDNYQAHVTSSMMHWHLRQGGPRRATLARSFS